MYTVKMERECACFKKSEYKSEKTFDNQQDAQNYTNILIEFMAEDFCTTHLFFSQKVSENDFLIRVVENPNKSGGGSCGTGIGSEDSSCSTGSCGCD